MTLLGHAWNFATRAFGRREAPSPTQKREAEKLLTDQVADDYRPRGAGRRAIYDGSAETPPVQRVLMDVEAMLANPRVRHALDSYCSGISGCEFEVEDASSPEHAKFALDEMTRFWRHHLRTAQEAYAYGRGAGELVYDDEDSALRLSALHPFLPFDARCLTQGGRFSGVRLPSEAIDLPGPSWMPSKAWWFAHRPRFDRWHGWPQVYSAWRPWRRLAGRDGAEEVVDGGVYRFAYTPFIGRYPIDDTMRNPDWGTSQGGGRAFINARDEMVGMLETLKAGGVIAMSSRRDPESGQYVWDVTPVQGGLDVSHLLIYTQDLEKAISLGIGVPPELTEASETGSGYSGRAIPMEAFLWGQQYNADAMCEAVYRLIVLPLLVWNFGPGAWARIRPKKLIEQRLKQQQGQANEQPQPNPGRPPGAPGDGKGGGNWQSYKGPRGGQGWQNAEGRKVYGDRPPGQRFATEPENEADRVEMFSTTRRRDGEEWVTNGRRYRREGGQTIRIPMQDRPQPAPARTGPRQNVEQARRTVQGMVDRLAGTGEGGPLSAADFEDLSSGLSLLTVPQLRAARAALAASFGGATRKEPMVAALRAHVRGMIARPAEQPEEATFIPDEEPEPPRPVPTPRQAVDAIRSTSLSAGEIERMLARMPFAHQLQVRELAGLPYSEERARIRDPQEYARALAQAIVEHRDRPAPTSTPPAPTPPPPRPPRGENVRVPGIEGRAADTPTLPDATRVSVDLGRYADAAREVFGGDIAAPLLAACANGFNGCEVAVEGSGRHHRSGGRYVQTSTNGPGLTATRTFIRHPGGKVEVHNDYFRTQAGSAYDGHGAAMFLNQVRALRAAGADHITTSAAGDFTAANSGGFNGYATWPKFGYDGNMDERHFGALPEPIKRRLGRSRSIQDLFAIPGGEEAWEIHGGWIELRFDLADGSKHLERLDKYLERRRSRPPGPSRADRALEGTPTQRMARKRAELEAKIAEKVATWSRT